MKNRSQVVVTVAVLLACVLSACGAAHACGRPEWTPETQFQPGGSVNPSCVCVNTVQQFEVDAADTDTCDGIPGYADGLTYTWSVSGGGTYTIDPENKLTWTAPATPGTVVISCVVDDVANLNGDSGSKNDQPSTVQWTVYVCKGEIKSGGHHVDYFYIPANEDDDNNDGHRDFGQAGEDPTEVKQVDVSVASPDPGCSFYLSITGDEENVRVYSGANRGQPLDLPVGGYLANGTHSYYVEGKGSGSVVTMTLAGGGTCVDQVQISPRRVDLDIGPFEGWEDANDGDVAEQASPGWPQVGCIVPYNGTAWVWIENSGGDGLKLEATSGGANIQVYDQGDVLHALPWTNPTRCYLKGVAPSATIHNVELKLSATIPGPHSYEMDDKVKVTVVQADLSIDGREESNEDTIARPIPANDDDDDLNSICDFSQVVPPTAVSNENELVQMGYAIRPAGVSGAWSVTPYQHQRLWADAERASAFSGEGSASVGTFYAEGRQFLLGCSFGAGPGAGDAVIDFTPSESRGPYSGAHGTVCSDTVKCNTVDPEINLEGLESCSELTTGGFLVMNDDDDDGVSGVDKYRTSPLPADDYDLKELTIAFWGGLPSGCSKELWLSVESGADSVRFWSDRRKSQQISLGTFYLESGHGVYSLGYLEWPGNFCSPSYWWTKTIYVEGIQASASVNDVMLKVAYQPNVGESLWYIDKLRFTVPEVIIVRPAQNGNDPGDRAVMISTNPDVEVDPNNRYPSPEQICDREILIEARVLPMMANFPIYLASFDIDDESPYEPDTNGGDNADGDGVLEAAPNYQYEGGTNQYLKMYTDPYGGVLAYLKVTDHAAGDNYAVCARALEWPSETEEDRTGKLVAWKRMYLEIDRMWKKGSRLVSNACSGANYVDVRDLTDTWDDVMFQSGTPILLFDTAGVQENHEVQSVDVIYDPMRHYRLHLDGTLTNNYLVSNHAAVGVVGAGFFDVSRDWLNEPFGSIANIGGADAGCFVDFREVPSNLNTKNKLPHVPVLTDGEMNEFSAAWFDNAGEPNVIHVGAIAYIKDTFLGYTDWTRNWSWVCVGNIAAKSWDLPVVADQVLAHEIVHQFDNLADDTTGVYDWGGEPNLCLMQSSSDLSYSWEDSRCELCVPHISGVRVAGDPQ